MDYQSLKNLEISLIADRLHMRRAHAKPSEIQELSEKIQAVKKELNFIESAVRNRVNSTKNIYC